jgi:hypothetical protein
MARKSIGALVVLIVAALWLFLIFSAEPKLPLASANGQFENACCGVIALSNGELSVNRHQSVRYVIEQDKVGAYVFPEALVSVLGGNQVQVDRGRTPLKLRLDRVSNPTQIELTDLRTGYAFTKQSLNVR